MVEVIDTVILKASYDLMTEDEAYASAILKLAGDVERGSELQTVKLARFTNSYNDDFLKFNFPVCGNLSSADLMLINAAMAGFNVIVVGNNEREKRNQLIQDTLSLEHVISVPELNRPVEQDDGLDAKKRLSFTNTQTRGYAALPETHFRRLVMEVAADQPLMDNFFRHAIDLSVDADFAVNLNAVNLMKARVPSFLRKAYDKMINSRGEEVDVKENNNHAQTVRGMKHNRPLFNFLYGNRNGGSYFNPKHLLKSLGVSGATGRLFRFCLENDETFGNDQTLLEEIKAYAAERKELGRAVSYSTVKSLFHVLFSPSLFERRAHVDATNDDIFACWDLDGLNNDYLGYRELFQRNFDNLAEITPHAEQVYRVHDALDRLGNQNRLMTEPSFEAQYFRFVIGLTGRMQNSTYLRELGISDDTIDKMQAMDIAGPLFERKPPEPKMIEDLEQHLKTGCLQRYEQDRDRYENMKMAA